MDREDYATGGPLVESYINLSSRDRLAYCQEAAARRGLPAASIEKDFWVCWTLRELFTLPEWGEHLSFKGGTSLSKAWALIDRFSEDIDVVIDRLFLGFDEEEPSEGRLKKLRERSARRIQSDLLPSLREEFQRKLGDAGWSLTLASKEEAPDGQTLIFEYPGLLSKSITYLRPAVKIEMGARSDIEPAELPLIRPYLYEILPDQLGSTEFPVRTVAARRTFWDKALLLHEENFRPEDRPRKRSLARHYYDLWALIEKGIAQQALDDPGLFERVVQHRRVFFRYNWIDYETMKPGSLRISPRDDLLGEWRTDYRAMQNEMFYGDVPDFEQVMLSVRGFQDSFNALGF